MSLNSATFLSPDYKYFDTFYMLGVLCFFPLYEGCFDWFILKIIVVRCKTIAKPEGIRDYEELPSSRIEIDEELMRAWISANAFAGIIYLV